MSEKGRKPEEIYTSAAETIRPFYAQAGSLYSQTFGTEPSGFYRAPGRVELGGNHTDHQGGVTLSASLDLDMIAATGPRKDGKLLFLSEGYPLLEMDPKDTAFRAEEKGSTASLLRGMLAAFGHRGYVLGESFTGLNIAMISRVPSGSGLSSSAALEILLACIFNDCLGAGFPARELAQMGRETEQRYFGKPCGLLDQLSCAWGGVISVDFSRSEPQIRPVRLDLDQTDYQLFMVFCGAGHEDLTEAYAAIPRECHAVAAYFGLERLSQVPEDVFWKEISKLRQSLGDRPVLRSIHVYEENRRALAQAEALLQNDFERFLHLVRESGRSSAMYLQNVALPEETRHQEMLLTLALCEHLLPGRGAVRVHGGGFGGTVEAFVPRTFAESFRQGIAHTLGSNSLIPISISAIGGTKVDYR